MSLDDFTSALREEGRLLPNRKKAVRRAVVAPKTNMHLAVRLLVPMAAVLAAVTAWAGVRERWWTPPPVETPIPKTLDAPPGHVEAPAVLTGRVVSPPPPQVVAASHPDGSARRALDAYRVAERLQFTDNDFARALDAWDHYLAVAGTSPLVVDARYQRALCLVHLGRTGDARAALAPFAQNPPGSYRQAEAKALLESLQ
jgi:hypothetical protein